MEVCVLPIESWVRRGSPEPTLKEFGEFLQRGTSLTRVLLTGRGKSGTTWVSRILNTHPQIAMKGERKLLAQNGPYEPLLRPFITGKALQDWGRFTSLRKNLDVDEDLGTEIARVVYDYLLARTVDLEGLSHIGDKIPFTDPDDVLVTLTGMNRMFPGLRVVHVVRDGRDVAVSDTFHQYRNRKSEGEDGEVRRRIENHRKTGHDRIFDDAQIRGLAESWSGVVEAIDGPGWERFEARMFTVRYEDLLADTRGCVEDLYDHVGLPWNDEIITEAIEETSFESMSGGREAGEENPSSFFRKGIAGDWANYFTEEDEAIFSEVAGSMLLRFGYSDGIGENAAHGT